jgi:hypothetical protein
MEPRKDSNGQEIDRTATEHRTPAGARLLAYFGHGAELAVIPGGMMLAVQADHLVETVRLGDILERRG